MLLAMDVAAAHQLCRFLLPPLLRYRYRLQNSMGIKCPLDFFKK
jgi:hypothetical protein